MSKDPGLPSTVRLVNLLNNRMKEISSLSGAISADKKFGKLAGQQVPRHMRRRAVAHDVHRLPRRLRDKYMREKESGGGNVPAAKRPSRKHRRRSSYLLAEYNRRQNKQFWLETHIWHAKRFHMYTKWGYKIPGFPNDKGWRACYRATKSSCLMFDISYYNTIQIQGPKSVITTELSRLTKKETGLTFNTYTTVQTQEQTALVYLPQADGSSSLAAEVQYIWLPADTLTAECVAAANATAESAVKLVSGGDTIVSLWISCHPAFVKDVWRALDIVFEVNLKQEENDKPEEENMPTDENEPPPSKKQKVDENKPETESDASCEDNDETNADEPSEDKTKKDVDKEKLKPRNVPFDRTPKYPGKEGVIITDLQGIINRFRLVGPKRLEILKTTCVPSIVTPTKSHLEAGKEGLQWWSDYYSNASKQKQNQDENEIFDKCKNVQNLTCLTVRDPRLLLPVKKYIKPAQKKVTKSTDTKSADNDTKSTDTKSADNDTKSTNGTADNDAKSTEPATIQNGHKAFASCKLSSVFFDPQIRDSVTLSKSSDCDINKRREKFSISGITIPLADTESRVPVLLSPNNQLDSLDLLVPAGWAMPFWMCLVYNGCRVGGQKEFNHLQLEQANIPLVYRYPESPAGVKEAETLANELQQDYFAHPPIHRVSYPRMGIASPFSAPWSILLKDWASEDALVSKAKIQIDGVQVVRDREVIKSISSVINISTICRNMPLSFSAMVQTAMSKTASLPDQNCLVPVKIKIACRGRLGANTLICLPSREDLEEVSRSGLWVGPLETQQEDEKEKERKETTDMHKAMKKRLKRRWKKLKDKQTLMKCQSTALGKDLDTEKLSNISSGMSTLKQMRNTENAVFGAKKEDLWVGDFTTVRHSCKREVMGYVTVGEMSYKEGCFVGFGFVALKAAKAWIQLASTNSKNLVLTREISSLQYRFSFIEFL